jgi:ribonucleoside-triphosphate reductase
MFGGQAHPNFDNDLAPFVDMTRKEIRRDLESIGLSGKELKEKTESMLVKRVRQAMQSVIYNLNTMHSRAGAQVPFSSINIGIPKTGSAQGDSDAAMLCQALLEEYLKGMGHGEQPIFPNIIFRVKNGVNREPKDKYYFLFQIACHVASQRMNPTFMNIDADFNAEYYKKGEIPSTMGCRTYVMSNVNGPFGTAGRGNIAPVTMNIVRLAIQAGRGNIKKFFELFDALVYKCKDQLMHRYSVLKNLKVSDLPFVAGQKLMKGSEKLNMDDSIEPILKQGSYGIGFLGLAETLKVLTGKHHGESEESAKLGVKIVTRLRELTDKFKQEYKLNFSCYATPAEGLSNKFTIADQKLFGDIPGINTNGFYTNSFHVPVDYSISYSKKIAIEAPYHKLCNAGHISYVEYDDYPTGTDIERIVRYAYTKTNISYIGINFHIRYCLDCAARTQQHAKNIAKSTKTSKAKTKKSSKK